MKTFKTEREWKDLTRADKVALFVGVFMWLIMSGCVYAQSQNHNQLKQNILKTQMMNHR